MKEKRNLQKTIGLILIIIGIILISISIFMTTSKNKNNNKNDNNIKEDKSNDIKKLSDVDIQELFSKTFMLGDNEYATIYSDENIDNQLYHSKYSMLFKDERVNFGSLFENDNDKLEISHILSGLGSNGTFRVDILKETYEKLFGGDSFKPKDYTVNNSMNCKIENESVICDELDSKKAGSCNAYYVKYVDGKQNDYEVFVEAYVLKSTSDCQSYQVNETTIEKFNGLKPNEIFTNKYSDELQQTKYNIVYQIDEKGSKILYVEPIVK